MILYIHGFASCGDSNKTKLLKAYFNDVLSPDVPVEPDEAIIFLQKLIIKHEVTMLIGSSLGAFYAAYLAHKFALKTVMINPSTQPYLTLAPYVGTNTFYCSNKPFEWKKEYLSQLMSYSVGFNSIKARVLVLLQKDDEVLDFKIAQEVYRDYEVIVQEGGNHRFENLNEYLEDLKRFYLKK